MNKENTVYCSYYIVDNENELGRALEELKVELITRYLYEFPFIIGQESGAVFQSDIANHPMHDYTSFYDRKSTYTYKFKQLKQ